MLRNSSPPGRAKSCTHIPYIRLLFKDKGLVCFIKAKFACYLCLPSLQKGAENIEDLRVICWVQWAVIKFTSSSATSTGLHVRVGFPTA